MRDLGPALVVSVALWASFAWCFFVVCTTTGHGHIHLSARDLGVFLLCIDLAFIAAIVWHDRLKPRGR